MEHRVIQHLRTGLLAWYDQHGRNLPWRAKRPHLPNPYHVWLSEMMLQQTTVVTVLPFFQSFIAKWPTLLALSQATQDEILIAWQGLGYYARARNLHACAQTIVESYGSVIPSTVEELIQLPGIGPYMSAAIASIAFNHPVVPVDGNVIRVLTRLYGLEKAMPAVKEDVMTLAERFAHPLLPGDFAQALMDLGATLCLPRNPKCHACPWQSNCQAFQHSNAERYPIKEPKKNKPTKYAVAFVMTKTTEQIFLRKRQAHGLLGGLYEVPTTDWSERQDDITHQGTQFLKTFQSYIYKGKIKHTFTHFHLEMEVYSLSWRESQPETEGIWVGLHDLDQFAFSTLMKKVISIGTQDLIWDH